MLLDVYLCGEKVGCLYTDKKYGLSFRYDEGAERPISISLPLSNEEYRKKKVEPFFSGLLPDGESRLQLAQNAHVSPSSVIKLLSHYGREIAGALVIINHGEEYSMEKDDYIPITESEIAQRIRNRESENLLLWGDNVRLSLAGAQNKLPLLHKDDRWFLPAGNSPSNCIIKPGKSIALNEFVVTRLAGKCGFNTPEVALKYFEDQLTFVSYRYDRVNKDGSLMRLHQEDMCQALSIPPEKKYQAEGGPGVRDIVKLIEDNSSLAVIDLREFYRILVFNFLVGNCDSHGKNYSFIYLDDNKLRLAPFYDNVCTTIYPGISRELSMKIGKKKNIDVVFGKDFLDIDGVKARAMERVMSEVASSFNSAINEMIDEEEYSPYREIVCKIKDDSLSRLERLLEKG